jgi:hypothetical protein
MRPSEIRFAKSGFAVLALAPALIVVCIGGTASAQEDSSRPRLSRRPPLRIEVEPQRRLVRECTDWHVIEHRLTGDTIVPRTRCVWAVR